MDLIHVHTQEPLTPDGVRVERYTTLRRSVYERWTQPNGVTVWYHVEREYPNRK